MTFRPPNIPAGFGTKDSRTQEDLRRLRDAIRTLSAQMAVLQARILAEGGGGGTPDPHADSHESGGSDEINVAGLSGVLADAQAADTIVESSGPTDLVVGSVADGEGLVRSGATVVGASVDRLGWARPTIWTPPETPHADDLEFIADSSLPSGFTLFNLTTGATPVSPISGIDPYTQPAAGNVRIESNKTAKRSWMLMQPRGENVRWLYAKKMVLSGTNGWVFRTRICTTTNATVTTVDNSSDISLVISKDDGTGNAPEVNGVSPFQTSNHVWLGFDSDSGTMSIQFQGSLSNTITVIRTLPDWNQGDAANLEVVLILTSGSLSNTWYAFLRTPNYTYFVGTATAANTGVKQGDTVWVGWEFFGISSNMPSSPVLSTDYMRFEDTAANFLP